MSGEPEEMEELINDSTMDAIADIFNRMNDALVDLKRVLVKSEHVYKELNKKEFEKSINRIEELCEESRSHL